MKKIITAILLMFSLCANAQHLKFMGISLDCSINSFQTKLATKDIEPVTEFNARTSAGSRLFKGIFCGYDAKIFSYYNSKTKVVYRCKACIDRTDKTQIINLYNKIKDMLDEKYVDACYDEGEQEGFENYSFLIKRDFLSECNWDESIGRIDLYISENSGQSLDDKIYTLHIDYIDKINSDKNNSLNKDDL